MGFVFYDLETTGISPAFDQPLQFAVIRTDNNFAEIDRVNLRCRIAPHIIPSPQALIVTGVTTEQLVDPSLPSLFEFTQTITELTERCSPATLVGFNTIRFDEEGISPGIAAAILGRSGGAWSALPLLAG